MVVRDAIKTAMKPEKCCGQLTSRSIDGLTQKVHRGQKKIKIQKGVITVFLDFGTAIIVDRQFFDVLVSAEALKVAISVSKTDFC